MSLLKATPSASISLRIRTDQSLQGCAPSSLCPLLIHVLCVSLMSSSNIVPLALSQRCLAYTHTRGVYLPIFLSETLSSQLFCDPFFHFSHIHFSQRPFLPDHLPPTTVAPVLLFFLEFITKDVLHMYLLLCLLYVSLHKNIHSL